MSCKVTEKLFEVTSMLWQEQKVPREYGGQLLYHAEAVLLNAIYKFPEMNASSISASLKITKGAVTQLSARLAQKNLLEAYTKEGNRKEKYFRLTAAGRAVYEEHKLFHEASNKRLCSYINTLDPEAVKTIFEFLNHLKSCVPFGEFECICDFEGAETEHSLPRSCST